MTLIPIKLIAIAAGAVVIVIIVVAIFWLFGRGKD
jgi:hypothetical protein